VPERAGFHEHRRAGGVHHRGVRAQHGVEQRGFAYIRIAHEHDARVAAWCFVAHMMMLRRQQHGQPAAMMVAAGVFGVL
jgi:hypothetical protein